MKKKYEISPMQVWVFFLQPSKGALTSCAQSLCLVKLKFNLQCLWQLDGQDKCPAKSSNRGVAPFS